MASVEGTDTYEPAITKQLLKQQPVRIILLVEATAAAVSGWSSIRKWLDVILQKMDVEINALAAQRQDPAQGPHSKIPSVQYALIVYGVRDRSTPAPVQCSTWTSLRTELATWLDGIQFVGGIASKGTALPQALAEAIVLSKSPYPGGAKPAAAAAGHPEPVPESDINLPVHTHLVVCCPAFNPCRLPLVWPYAADTKARLFSFKFYHMFLEKYATLQADKCDRVMYGLCTQLDFIKGSLHQITPGTVDVWDLIMALPRHHLSLSVISSSLKSAASRTSLELFAYGNYPVGKLKMAVQRCFMCANSVGVGVYLSPLFIEGQRAFKPIWGKLLEKRKQLQQHAQQQQQQRQQQQQQQQQAHTQVSAPTTQQQGTQQAAKQAAHHATHQASQQQQQAMQQAQVQQQARQYKQQQVQVQQQQKAQQQHWQHAAAHPAVAMPPTAAASAASMASANQAQQQQRLAATQAAGLQQQQQQLLQQQQRYGLAPVGQGGAGVQQQQQQQQQQLPVAAQGGIGMGMNAAQAGMMSQQQPQQQQQPLVMLVQPGMQQMLVQQQAVAGFMQPQQLISQQMLQQQQQQQQQLLQQQQQVPMAVAQMAPAPVSVMVKQEKARVAFWSGQIVLKLPELGQQVLAQVELSCSNPSAMKQNWAQRNQLVVHKIMQLQDVKQMLASYKKITKVAYRVLQPGPMAWQWLQQQIKNSPQQQVYMLVQLTPSDPGVFFFGNQAKEKLTTSYNMNEGSFILCGVDP